jgi:EmrB/QacA subfamily drug resistance transporter
MNDPTPTRREIVFTMIAVMTSLLLASLDSTIVGTAMPKIIADLNGMQHYGWPFTAYMLSSTIAVVLFGKLSDIWGRKRVFILGIVLFLVASTLCGISATMPMLILFRGFQGAGGGIISSSAFIIVGGMFPPAERGRYMGILASVYGLSSVLGPTIGGLITDALSWRWVFYVNAPLGVASLMLVGLGMKPLAPRAEKLPPDIAGAALLTIGTLGLLMGVTQGGAGRPWGSLSVQAAIWVGAAALTGFILVERHAKDPIVPMRYFTNRTFVFCVTIGFLSNAAMFCAVIYVSLLVQGVLGASASLSGGATTPMMLGLVASAIASGQLMSRRGRYKAVAFVGFILTGSGFALLTLTRPNTPLVYVLFITAVVGIGIGVAIPIFNTAAQNAFGRKELATVTATIQFCRSMGAAIGSAALSFVLTSTLSGGVARIAKDGIGRDYVSALTDPKVLADHDQLATILSRAPDTLQPTLLEIVHQMRHALAQSIHAVFTVGIGLAVACLALTLIMREVPLKRRSDESPDSGLGQEPKSSGLEATPTTMGQ